MKHLEYMKTTCLCPSANHKLIKNNAEDKIQLLYYVHNVMPRQWILIDII